MAHSGLCMAAVDAGSSVSATVLAGELPGCLQGHFRPDRLLLRGPLPVVQGQLDGGEGLAFQLGPKVP